MRRLREAGAIVLGKTNMDQFATGLVGTRSPYGVVSSIDDPTLISGGSSSGSGVVVAAGLADIALGTDTAGSGRVPAAFNRIYGIKPTVGLIPVTGVTPACPSFDVVSIFCTDLKLGQRALAVMAGPDGKDAKARDFSPSAPLGMAKKPVVIAPVASNIEGMDEQWRRDFNDEISRFESLGYVVRQTDVSVMLEAAELLYGGSLVAERYASIGSAYASEYDPAVGEDPSVRAIVLEAGHLSADSFVKDQQRLKDAKLQADRIMTDADLLILPTTTRHPSIADVQERPIAVNSDLGRFTNFVNLLDYSALAVPSLTNPSFSVTLIAEAFHDFAILDLAQQVYQKQAVPAEVLLPHGVGENLFVVGEHMRGLSLNGQLQQLGARFVEVTSTANGYELVALNTKTPKPTLIFHAKKQEILTGVEGELWCIPAVGLTKLLKSLPSPMALGPVYLADGRKVTGFGVDASVYEAENISAYGSWRRYQDKIRATESTAA